MIRLHRQDTTRCKMQLPWSIIPFCTWSVRRFVRTFTLNPLAFTTHTDLRRVKACVLIGVVFMVMSFFDKQQHAKWSLPFSHSMRQALGLSKFEGLLCWSPNRAMPVRRQHPLYLELRITCYVRDVLRSDEYKLAMGHPIFCQVDQHVYGQLSCWRIEEDVEFV